MEGENEGGMLDSQDKEKTTNLLANQHSLPTWSASLEDNSADRKAKSAIRQMTNFYVLMVNSKMKC